MSDCGKQLRIKRNDTMMAGTHCAQCSDTRNIYIKTCECSKKQVNQQKSEKFNSEKEQVNTSSIVDTKKQTEEPKLKAVKAIVYKVVRVYETVPSKTMKFVGALALLFLLVAVFSVALAQNKEETKSHYGMAFPLEDSASANSEHRISIVGSVPGEGSQTTTSELTSESPITTTITSSSDESATISVIPVDNDKKLDEPESENDSGPTFLIAGDTDDEEENNKPSENGEEKTNPRLVFIERLMGVHLSAPLNEQQGEKEVEDNSALDNGSPNPSQRTPFDKLNAKWATRMRKFSIPLMQQQQQQQAQSEPQNQLLRVAAAAMMTRLLAAAARAHHNEQLSAPKDKDDDMDDDSVPLLLATLRSNGLADRPISRPMAAPMYGRPMPIRPPMMRPAVNRPPISFIPPQARMASTNVQPRVYSSPMMHLQQKAAQPVMQRPFQPYQQVLIMLAHVPVQSSPVQVAESRMGGNGGGVSQVAVSPYYNAPQHSMQIYPQVPYSVPMGYNHIQQRPVEVPVSVHIPVPVPVASYQRPVYQNYQNPYQANGYQRQVTQMAPSRPVIEIPIEIPIPVHVPVPVSMQSMQQYSSNRIQSYQHEQPDHDQSASEADQVAIVYLDADSQEGFNGHYDNLEPQTSESHENHYRLSPQKSYPYLSRPLPDTQSATKMKLWREYIGAKHAAQPGVRYIPVAVATDDLSRAGHHSQLNHEQSEPSESQHQPAFVILADDGADVDGQQERSI